MENIVNLQCHDLYVFACIEGKVYVNFLGYDMDKNVTTNIVAPIHEQINEIYRNKVTKEFLDRLIYKLKLTMRLKPAKITFKNVDGNWLLKTEFMEIYDAVTLSPDGTKMGDDPLTLDGKISRIFSLKGKIFLECLIKEIDMETNEFVERIKTIKITKEINTILNTKELRDKFREVLYIKGKNKNAFLEGLSQHLEGKTLAIEYDEHYGYSLWTVLEDLIYIN
jgi:hypothetical protein